MVGDGRGEREPHPVAGERPRPEGSLPRREALRERLRRNRLRLAPQRVRKRIQQARNRPVEGPVGHHRSHDRAHPCVGVGAPDRLEPLRGRCGKLEVEVVGGGASLSHHLHRTDEGREVLVLDRAVACNPRRGVEQQLQRPAIAETLGEIVVPVRVGVDQARHEEPAGRVAVNRVRRRGQSRRPDLANRILLDEHVGGLRGLPLGVEEPPTPDDRMHGCRTPRSNPLGR